MKVLNLLVLALLVSFASCKQANVSRDTEQEYPLIELTTRSVTSTSSYSASIKGRQDIRIVPRVDGYLVDIAIKEGSRVREGETLFVIDQVQYKAALKAAEASVSVCEAQVATASLTMDSKRKLFEKKIISEFDLLNAENGLKTAEAQLAQAKAQAVSAANNLSFTVIKSPSNGVAGKLPFRKGDYVSPQIAEGLTVIADNSEMYIYFSMNERQIMDLVAQHKSIDEAIKAMPEVELQLSNQSIYPYKGRIESISGVIDATTGAVSVRASFPNKQGLLLSGGSGSVIMPVVREAAIVIPQEATFEIQGKIYVYKVVNGKAVSSIISIDKINNGKEYVVTEGATAGDVIIAEGAGLVQEGISIKSKEKK